MLGGYVVPDGKDHFGTVDFAGGEAVQLPLGPLLVEKVRADHDDAEPGACKTVVDGPAQAVADGERELVELDREAPRAKGSGERADEVFLVLASVADEDVPVHNAGAVAQIVAGDVGGELPTVLIADCAGLGGSRAEI